MKRSKLTTFTVLVLLVTMVALILVSGTYAKYTTEVSGTDTAIVAKFDVGGVDESSFNLFDTVKEADGTTTENEVASGTIAPGTGGSFEIKLTNDSDVAVSYTLSVEETSNTSNVPIEYSTDGTNYVTAAGLSTVATGTMDIGSTTQQTKSVTIYWRWAYEGTSSTNYTGSQTDITDTELGENGTAEVEVKASVVFTQVD